MNKDLNLNKRDVTNYATVMTQRSNVAFYRDFKWLKQYVDDNNHRLTLYQVCGRQRYCLAQDSYDGYGKSVARFIAFDNDLNRLETFANNNFNPI